MASRKITDASVVTEVKNLTGSEREIIVRILRCLKEIEHRRLFADYGYKSLFDFAVAELKYSEGQASRRIQAMRLLKDLPEMESKISSGELSLSNVQQAQSFFRELKVSEPQRLISKSDKLELLSKLENKSVREGQKELIKLNPRAALPKEKERQVTDDASEVRFVMDDKLKAKLEEVRSLLGIGGASMSFAELFNAMSDLSLNSLKAKRFGKKRAEEKPLVVKKEALLPASVPKNASSRYISQELKLFVWQRDSGRCCRCGSKYNLNFDHIKPFALGGTSTPENIRLLCFSCNQRANVKTFGHIKSTKPHLANELLERANAFDSN